MLALSSKDHLEVTYYITLITLYHTFLNAIVCFLEFYLYEYFRINFNTTFLISCKNFNSFNLLCSLRTIENEGLQLVFTKKIFRWHRPMTLRLSLVSPVLDVGEIFNVAKICVEKTGFMWGSILPPADNLVHVG